MATTDFQIYPLDRRELRALLAGERIDVEGRAVEATGDALTHIEDREVDYPPLCYIDDDHWSSIHREIARTIRNVEKRCQGDGRINSSLRKSLVADLVQKIARILGEPL